MSGQTKKDSQLTDNPFLSFEGEDIHISGTYTDDLFFEEALSTRKTRSDDQNRTFIGSIVEPKRFKIALLLAGVFFCLFLTRAAYWQIARGDHFRSLADGNRVYSHTIPSQRGIILDRNGVILAQNIPSFNAIISSDILHNSHYDVAVQELADMLMIDLEAFDQRDKQTISQDILFAQNISYEQGIQLMSYQQKYPWLRIEITSLREYQLENSLSLAHVLGYTAGISSDEYKQKRGEGYRLFDPIGKLGLELSYERLLRGTYGQELRETNAQGETQRILSKVDPQNGENLVITIDSKYQTQIEDILHARLKGTQASRAVVIAMNPQNGEILALVSYPGFDANLFTQGIEEQAYYELLHNEDQPLYPRALLGEYPSGSTIKPIFAAAALIEGVITPYTNILSTGGIRVSRWFFPDWRPSGHGQTNVYHAIADSVNTFFYLIGGGNESFDGLELELMMSYARQFGFGEPTGIDLPTEADGFLPTKAWKEETKGEQWYIGDTYHVAIGQGDLLVTPLQIARATAVFANEGFLVTPHLNTAIQGEMKPVIENQTAQIIKDAMRQTVTAGSARALQATKEPVAGKTGTAQWSSQGIPHSWFTGFGPYNDPEILLTVLIEEGGETGLAVPVALDAFNAYFSGVTD